MAQLAFSKNSKDLSPRFVVFPTLHKKKNLQILHVKCIRLVLKVDFFFNEVSVISFHLIAVSIYIPIWL